MPLRAGSTSALCATWALIFLTSSLLIHTSHGKKMYGWGDNSFSGVLATGDFSNRNVLSLATTINVTSLGGSDINLFNTGVYNLIYYIRRLGVLYRS
jgi:hypothetical protein